MAAEFVDARHKGKTISYSDILDKGPESWVNEDDLQKNCKYNVMIKHIIKSL